MNGRWSDNPIAVSYTHLDVYKRQVLEYAAEAESFSNHPIAKSILAAYEKMCIRDRCMQLLIWMQSVII